MLRNQVSVTIAISRDSRAWMTACHKDSAAFALTFNTHSFHISVQHSLRMKRWGKRERGREMQVFLAWSFGFSFEAYSIFKVNKGQKIRNYVRHLKTHTHISGVSHTARSITFWKCSRYKAVIWFDTFNYISVQRHTSILLIKHTSYFPLTNTAKGMRDYIYFARLFEEGKKWRDISILKKYLYKLKSQR